MKKTIAFALFAVSIALAQPLPWSVALHASGSNATLAKAKYHCESALRWKIEQERRVCQGQQGHLSYPPIQTNCTKAGALFTCHSSTTVTCR